MTGNRSLDEFLGGETADEPGGPSDDVAGAGSAEAPDAAAPDEVASTAAASSEAAPTPGTSGAEPADGAATAGEASADDGATPDPDAVEPMAETVAWSPGGGACSACGERAETRWRDGDALVCGDCKAW